MPEQLINQLVQQKLRSSECMMHGWVLEGFPQTLGQINLLNATRVNPNIYIQLEIAQDEAQERYFKKRVDPVTGNEYNIGIQLIDLDVKERLVYATSTVNEFIRNGFNRWNENLVNLEDSYGDQISILNVRNKKIEEVTTDLCEIIFQKHLNTKFEFNIKQ